ncbi:MAG: LCP family protein [Lactobacillales bacterium]|jgi:LCP family protein required for cell wall assembly|nr:LCP family protein [Lactobacillales bacterium]
MGIVKKVILIVLSVLVFADAGLCVFAVHTVGEAHKAVNKMHKAVKRDSTPEGRDWDSILKDQKPVSFLLMGIDDGYSAQEKGGRVPHNDTDLIVTINPQTKKTTVLSVQRDIYATIVGNEKPAHSKYNTSFLYGSIKDPDTGGAKMAIETTENLVGIPIDHYVAINMDGVTGLVDAVGGIDVNNEREFELDGVHLMPGEQHLSGIQALQYARYRHEDPKGDIGRQDRTREVVVKVINKLLSADGIANYKKVLDAVGSNVATDLTWDDMLKLEQSYAGALKDIESLSMQVASGAIPGDRQAYLFVLHDDLLRVQNILRTSLGLTENQYLSNQIPTYESMFGFTPTHANANLYDAEDSTGTFENPNVKEPAADSK